MLKVWKVIFQNSNDISLCCTLLGEYAAKICEDRLNLFYRPLLGVLDSTKVYERRFILDIGTGVELLKCLLPTRIAPKKLTRVTIFEPRNTRNTRKVIRIESLAQCRDRRAPGRQNR